MLLLSKLQLMKFFSYLLILIIIVSSCDKDKSSEIKELIPALQEVSNLATVEYVVTKIIKANDNKTWYKIGERKILMSCKASLVAGLDLSEINEDDISISGKKIRMTLPKAKLLIVNIKPEDIKTEYEDVSLFRNPFTNAERDALAAQGEIQIKNSAASLGLLQAAEVNAGLLITNLLKKLGYETIDINFDNNKKELL